MSRRHPTSRLIQSLLAVLALSLPTPGRGVPLCDATTGLADFYEECSSCLRRIESIKSASGMSPLAFLVSQPAAVLIRPHPADYPDADPSFECEDTFANQYVKGEITWDYKTVCGESACYDPCEILVHELEHAFQDFGNLDIDDPIPGCVSPQAVLGEVLSVRLQNVYRAHYPRGCPCPERSYPTREDGRCAIPDPLKRLRDDDPAKAADMECRCRNGEMGSLALPQAAECTLPDVCGGKCQYEGQECWCARFGGNRTCVRSIDGVLYCNGGSSILCVSLSPCRSDADCPGQFCYPDDPCAAEGGGVCYSAIPCESQLTPGQTCP